MTFLVPFEPSLLTNMLKLQKIKLNKTGLIICVRSGDSLKLDIPLFCKGEVPPS